VGRLVQPAALTDPKAQTQKKVTTYLGRNVSQEMWAFHLLMPKSGHFTDVEASDAEGEF